ncbi:hypothetical protein ACIA49_30330 [Kribbella sp. NPDC051587]|uniref:hypothetical protein n=1 Tax=Kribbella sp. NPDC051587 TaxID=3364119 RepID=UPI003797B4F2
MTDLRDLLRNAAAEAENVSVDGSALLPTIRRRRRVRSAAIGAGSVTAVTTLAVGAYAVLPGAPDAPVAGGFTAPTHQPAQCNPHLDVQLTAGLRMELTQRAMKQTGENTWTGTVKIKITNRTKFTLYTMNAPTEYLVVPARGDQKLVGQAVAKPVQLDVVLKPGASHVSDVKLTVRGCGQWNKQPGSYLVYASKGGEPLGSVQLP